MAQPDVAQAHVAQGFQLGTDPGNVPEELQCLIDGHFQHVGDAPVAHGHFHGFPIVAAALANLAGHGNVGQKLHFNLVGTLSLASLAASSLDIEGKTARLVAAHPGLGQRGEQLPDRGKGPGVGGRVAAGRTPDGRLVDVDHLVYVLDTRHRIMVAGIVPRAVEDLG